MARYGTVKNQMERLANTSMQQPEEIRERRTAAEDLLGSLSADIGKEGTYDLPGSSTTAPPVPSPPVAGPTGLLSKDGYSFKGTQDVKKYDKLIEQGHSPEEAAARTGGRADRSADSIFKTNRTYSGQATKAATQGVTFTTTVDQDKAKAQIESSSAFRQVSRMMAESEQMLARSGPLYDEMMRSTQLPIIEGAAAAARENTENIRKAMARGGAARRDAFAAIQKIRSQEQLNMTKGQQLADAHLKMDQWVRSNAKEVINFATGWAQNQAGIRESYHSAMDAATQLMSTSALPFVFAVQQKEQEYRDAASAQSRGKVMKQISAVLGVATSVVGLVGSFYGQGGGSSAGAAMMADSIKGPEVASSNYYGAGGQGGTNIDNLPTGPDAGYGG